MIQYCTTLIIMGEYHLISNSEALMVFQLGNTSLSSHIYCTFHLLSEFAAKQQYVLCNKAISSVISV